MRKKYVLMCHSVGDTNAIVDVADELISKDVAATDIVLVALGKPAQDRFDQIATDGQYQGIPVYSIGKPPFDFADVFTPDQHGKAKNLSDAQLNQILQTLKVDQTTSPSVLIGNPSSDSPIPFQLAEKIADQYGVRPVMYNEYLFEDATTRFVEGFKSNHSWVQRVDVALPTKLAEEHYRTFKGRTRLYNVGHRVIDAALQPAAKAALAPAAAVASAPVSEVRHALGVGEANHFVFFSGSKNTEDDLAVFNALLENLAKHPKARLVLGMHPGHPELLEYATAILGKLAERPDVSANVRIIIPARDNLYDTLRGLGILSEEQFAKSCVKAPTREEIQSGAIDLSGSSVNKVADATAGAVPGQLLFDTILRKGSGSAASLDEKTIYIPGVSFGDFASLFKSRASGAGASAGMTREDCGVPKESMRECVAKLLMKK